MLRDELPGRERLSLGRALSSVCCVRLMGLSNHNLLKPGPCMAYRALMPHLAAKEV